jgi:hypothetical protein
MAAGEYAAAIKKTMAVKIILNIAYAPLFYSRSRTAAAEIIPQFWRRRRSFFYLAPGR